MPQPRALVLDDDAPLRNVLRETLGSEGWSVRCAARGEVAMQMAVLCRPDVVLLDLSRPQFAPEALATGLRIHYGPALPILAMSTSAAPELATSIGAYAFLQKPFELDRLMLLMHRGLALVEHSVFVRACSREALDRLRQRRDFRPLD